MVSILFIVQYLDMYLQPVLHKYMHIRYYYLIWTVSALPLCMILNQYWQINKKLLLPARNKYTCVNSLTSLVDGAEAKSVVQETQRCCLFILWKNERDLLVGNNLTHYFLL